MKIRLTTNQLVLASAAFLTAFANLSLFRHLAETFGHQPQGWWHIAAIGLMLFAALVVLVALLSFRIAIKPWLVLLLLLAAGSASFMDTYDVVIDRGMVANALATDAREVADLLTPRFFIYFMLIAILPAVLLMRVEIRSQTLGREAFVRSRLLAVCGVMAVAIVLADGSFFASFVREHKPLRYYANPITPLYSLYSLHKANRASGDGRIRKIGRDARIPPTDIDRELVVMVVGETARADHFSLNGYERNTNPLLERESVYSFRNVTSCGTSTEVSVPCMFSNFGHEGYSGPKALVTYNALDVLAKANVNILWRDNNSGSKGVAARVEAEDFTRPDINPVCSPECRDEGMLMGLQDYVESHPKGDILIVLHQMGSHGPSYYKRYPPAFGHFAPACNTPSLDACSSEQVSNSYDNTILYTDYFLEQVIGFLRSNDSRFETAMLYVGDHGESLGEAGVYLHGLPYWMAPRAQTHVPLILWFGVHYEDANGPAMQQMLNEPLSHDQVFHTLLGLFEIRSQIYEAEDDLISRSRLLAGVPGEYD